MKTISKLFTSNMFLTDEQNQNRLQKGLSVMTMTPKEIPFGKPWAIFGSKENYELIHDFTQGHSLISDKTTLEAIINIPMRRIKEKEPTDAELSAAQMEAEKIDLDSERQNELNTVLNNIKTPKKQKTMARTKKELPKEEIPDSKEQFSEEIFWKTIQPLKTTHPKATSEKKTNWVIEMQHFRIGHRWDYVNKDAETVFRRYTSGQGWTEFKFKEYPDLWSKCKIELLEFIKNHK